MVVLAFANEQEGRGYLHELPREARELCGPASHLSFLLRRSVRHTDAFPNSARLVRVSCLECVFRVHASVVPPV